jgi:hypothetical protein
VGSASQGSRLALDKDRQMLAQYRGDRLGNANDPPAGLGVGRPEQDLAGRPFYEGSVNPDRTRLQIKAATRKDVGGAATRPSLLTFL